MTPYRSILTQICGGTSVARRPPNRAYRFLRGSGKSNVVVGTCENGPITAEPCRAQAMPLLRASILFRPHDTGLARKRRPVNRWWRRRVPPPGPQRLFRKAFSTVVGQARHPQYNAGPAAAPAPAANQYFNRQNPTRPHNSRPAAPGGAQRRLCALSAPERAQRVRISQAQAPALEASQQTSDDYAPEAQRRTKTSAPERPQGARTAKRERRRLRPNQQTRQPRRAAL